MSKSSFTGLSEPPFEGANVISVVRTAPSCRFDRLPVAVVVHEVAHQILEAVRFGVPQIRSGAIDLFLQQQGLDTTTPSGKAMFQMMGVFAEFERAMIQERVRAGVARARAEGTKSGKPIGRPTIPASTERAIAKALQNGLGIHRVARSIGVGAGTVQRIKAALCAPTE